MKYGTILWLICVLIIITLSIVGKKGNKTLYTILIGLFFFIFIAQVFLPRQLFGKWNSISKLENKKITQIILSPSEPTWQVNLVDKDFIISKESQIDTLIDLLENVELYFPGHPSRIWETKMIIISDKNDSLEIKVNQTENNGTDIYTPTNGWRKDKIGSYLERLANYSKPVYGVTSTIKN